MEKSPEGSFARVATTASKEGVAAGLGRRSKVGFLIMLAALLLGCTSSPPQVASPPVEVGVAEASVGDTEGAVYAERVLGAIRSIEKRGIDSSCYELMKPIPNGGDRRCLRSDEMLRARSKCDDSPDLLVWNSGVSWDLCRYSQIRARLTSSQQKILRSALGYLAAQLEVEFGLTDVPLARQKIVVDLVTYDLTVRVFPCGAGPRALTVQINRDTREVTQARVRGPQLAEFFECAEPQTIVSEFLDSAVPDQRN